MINYIHSILCRNELTEKLTGIFTLNVNYEDQTFNLKFGGSSTVLEVKNGLYALTNVEVRNQNWLGWPPSVKDEMPLALSGITLVFNENLSIEYNTNYFKYLFHYSYPEHDFILSRNSATDNEANHNNAIIRIDSDDEEFVDAAESINGDDDCFVEDLSYSRQEPLSKFNRLYYKLIVFLKKGNYCLIPEKTFKRKIIWSQISKSIHFTK